jgi:hypothetical protein
MPVRSLHSSVHKWPDRTQVDAAARSWAAEMVRQHPEVVQLGYFGSYARGDWGVGSDLDMIALITHSDVPFTQRPLAWNLLNLPVPAEIVIYTLAEWQRLQAEGRRLARVIADEAVWIYVATAP